MADISFRTSEIYCYFSSSSGKDIPIKVSGALDLLKTPHTLRYTWDSIREGDAHITITGVLPVIRFLDKIIHTADNLEWFLQNFRNQDAKKMKDHLAGYVLDEVFNPSSTHNAEEQIYLNDLLMRILDEAYETLKADSSIKGVEGLCAQVRPSIPGQHYLAHPYYQLIVALYKQNQTMVDEYNAANVITRFSLTKPDEKLVQHIANRAKLIPPQFKREFYTFDFKSLQAEVERQLSVQTKKAVAASQLKI